MKAIHPKTFVIKTKVLILVLSLLFTASFSLDMKAQDDEEKLINEVPKHLPIKIEIINGKSEDLLSDLEVKVTNTGEKPIYFLDFIILTTKDYLSSSGKQLMFEMKYGRKELVTFGVLANDEDVPIKKGESYTFKVDQREVENFKESMRRSFSSVPQKYLLKFQFLNFGDGTGFWATGGTPFSTKKKKLLLSKVTPNGFFLTQNQKKHPV